MTELTLYLTFCKSDNADMLYISTAGEMRTGCQKVRVVDWQNSSRAFFLIADLLKSEESE